MTGPVTCGANSLAGQATCSRPRPAFSSPREAGEVEEVVAGFPDVDIAHSIDGEFSPDFGVGGAGQAVPRLLLIPEMTDWVTREGGAEAFGLGDDRPLPFFLAGRCQRRRSRQR